jgi:hypothetical protein
MSTPAPAGRGRVSTAATATAGAIDDAIGSRGRRERKYSSLDGRIRADDSTAGILLGPLPPPQAMLEVPVGQVGSKLFAERKLAREYVLKNSPVLFHTESWIETLLTPREWMPPPILVFVIFMVRGATRGAH